MCTNVFHLRRECLSASLFADLWVLSLISVFVTHKYVLHRNLQIYFLQIKTPPPHFICFSSNFALTQKQSWRKLGSSWRPLLTPLIIRCYRAETFINVYFKNSIYWSAVKLKIMSSINDIKWALRTPVQDEIYNVGVSKV